MAVFPAARLPPRYRSSREHASSKGSKRPSGSASTSSVQNFSPRAHGSCWRPAPAVTQPANASRHFFDASARHVQGVCKVCARRVRHHGGGAPLGLRPVCCPLPVRARQGNRCWQRGFPTVATVRRHGAAPRGQAQQALVERALWRFGIAATRGTLCRSGCDGLLR